LLPHTQYTNFPVPPAEIVPYDEKDKPRLLIARYLGGDNHDKMLYGPVVLRGKIVDVKYIPVKCLKGCFEEHYWDYELAVAILEGTAGLCDWLDVLGKSFKWAIAGLEVKSLYYCEDSNADEIHNLIDEKYCDNVIFPL